MNNIPLSTLDTLVEEANKAISISKELEMKRDEELNNIKGSLNNGATTGDELLDLSIVTFGKDFRDLHQKLGNLREILNQRNGEYITIIQRETDIVKCIDREHIGEYNYNPIHFQVRGIGVLANNPLTVGRVKDNGYYFLKINFKDGEYIVIIPPRVKEIMNAISYNEDVKEVAKKSIEVLHEKT